MPFYLVVDYIVPIYTDDGALSPDMGDAPIATKIERYTREYRDQPKSYRVIAVDAKTDLRVVFYDHDRGRFLIGAPNRRIAYAVSDALRGVLSAIWGTEPRSDRFSFGLHELAKLPRQTWSERQLIESLAFIEPYLYGAVAMDLNTGTVIDQYKMKFLPAAVGAVVRDRHLSEALAQLILSKELFYGFMVSSYYSAHYVPERRNTGPALLEKQYLEHRARYELSFVAAFKGIERFLRTNQVKAPNVARIMD